MSIKTWIFFTKKILQNWFFYSSFNSSIFFGFVKKYEIFDEFFIFKNIKTICDHQTDDSSIMTFFVLR